MVSLWTFKESANCGGPPDLHGLSHRRYLKGISLKARISSLPRQPKPKRRLAGLKHGLGVGDGGVTERGTRPAPVFMALGLVTASTV
jgi:hypothetical protein